MKKIDVINHFGSASKLSRALGITRMAVQQWGEDVPELRTYQIERLVDAAKSENVDISQLRIGKGGRVVRRLQKGESAYCVLREQRRLANEVSQIDKDDQL